MHRLPLRLAAAALLFTASPLLAQTAPKPAATPAPAAAAAAAAAAPKADAAKTDAGKTDAGKTDAAKADATLPGGASSLRESFDDWTVSCALPGGRRVCALSQVQVDQQSKQRALAFEVGGIDAKGISGIMALPFGLALAPGVTLQIDDGAPLAALPFQVCLPAGCIVQFRFEGDTLAKLKTGKQVKINAKAFEGGQTIVLNVSLNGFAPGLTRLQSLL